MPVPLIIIEAVGARVYQFGRVGFDSGTADPGGNFTATMRTEQIAPAGESGLCQFRRVGFRIFRTGSFTMTIKVYVDGVQTKVYDANSVLVDQVITISKEAPSNSPETTLVEADIDGRGTYVEVELTVTSNNIVGLYLPEELDIHYRPLQQSSLRIAKETS